LKKRKLCDTELLKRLDAGESYVEIAKRFGITKQAVHDRTLKLRRQTTKAVIAAPQHVRQIASQQIDAIGQLQQLNQTANEMLDAAVRTLRGVELPVIDPFSENDPPAIRDPHKHVLAIMAEIRGQLKLQLELLQCLYSIQEAQNFQATVLEVIGEVAPDVRNEIITRINRKRAIRGAVQLPQ